MVKARPSGIYGTELKNLMERFIQQIKDKTECFSMIISRVEVKRLVIGSTFGTG
jgi:hypothetical protein